MVERLKSNLQVKKIREDIMNRINIFLFIKEQISKHQNIEI